MQCTTGEKGSASYILDGIRNLVKYTIGKDTLENPHVNFMHTVALDRVDKGTILTTIHKIEEKTNVLPKWKEYNNMEDPSAAFVVKVDVSNIPIEKIHEHIHDLEIRLLGIGYYVYCIDYTQDFSGTLCRKDLVDYFLSNYDFKIQGEDIYTNAKYTILNNTSSVGRNVFTYIHQENKNIHRVKFYNKIASNFEAGEVRSCMGSHLADYVYSSNKRLRDVFYVQERGITRIEISIYGSQKEIGKERGQEVVSNVLSMVSKREPLFYIQPAIKQWHALAERLTKCCCLVDRPNSNIYMAWYANTLTKRIVEVKAELKNMVPDKLENFIQWFISDFGFKMVPIYRVDILETDTEKIHFYTYTMLY